MSARSLALAAALLAVAASSPALAEAPAAQPTRDVDVTYRVPVPGGAGASLLQRLRWSAARRLQRVDLPTSGNWMVLDFASHRMAMVRDDDRQILDLPAPATAGQAGAAYARVGADTVAGLACTQWRTTDTRGEATLACTTDDGVMLRATAGDRVLMEAVSVNYAPQDQAVFALPAGYTHH
jgi:hypothetical protein